MPREVRKRGKKHKKTQNQGSTGNQTQDDDTIHNSNEPSWIVPPSKAEDTSSEAPFGYVEPEVKEYFRSVDEQMQSWQEDRQPAGEDGDPNQEKPVFFAAALGEISGKERELATDPNCSVFLERMTHSMDDFVLRVFIDRLSGSFEVLFKHRFASHVCQTLFSVAAPMISREVKNISSHIPASEDDGELRTLTQLVLDICDEIAPCFNSLIMDSFASHVLRSLLLLLCPTVLPEDAARKHVRSKKSITWKAKQGHMKSVFSDTKGREIHASSGSVPASFRDAATRFLQILKDGLDANEVRALAANKVASPLLQFFLEIEADQGNASSPDSLMDRVLVGMIKACHEDPTASVEPSDYLVTLLRDPTSSHLLETLMSRCPEQVFSTLWSTYFQGKLTRLALHPVANFVVTKAVERQDGRQLGETLQELSSSWSKLIKSSRTGVLRALIERSCVLGLHQEDVCKAVFSAVEISDPDRRNNLVLCMLSLTSSEEYQAVPVLEAPLDAGQKKRGRKGQSDSPTEPKIQGALILQSLLRLDEPHCSIVVNSIGSLSKEDLIHMACNATSSRVLDVLLESPTVPFKAKRQFVMSIIGHYHTLADDRIGSRIADRCWAFADPYLREKIARSLIPFEGFLTASFYGKFFARNLNLYLLQRRPGEWKTMQSNANTGSKSVRPSSCPPVQSQATSPPTVPTITQTSTKRCGAPEDEIDAVFNTAFGTKTKRGAMDRVSTSEAQRTIDERLSEVMGAIREAPGESRRKKKRKVD